MSDAAAPAAAASPPPAASAAAMDVEEKSSAAAAPASSPAASSSREMAPIASASSASASAAAAGPSSAPSIAGRVFWTRLHALFEQWKKGGKAWGSAPPAGASASAPATGPPVDSIVLLYGPGNDDGDEYDRVLAVHNFLFGYEFADTALALCRSDTGDSVVIISSAKKCKLLEAIGKDDRPQPIKLQLYVANKSDKNAANIALFLKALKASKAGKRVGTIPDKGERAASPLTSALQSALKKSGMEIGVDVSQGFSGLLAVKDAAARENIQKAAEYTSKVLKKVVIQKMEDILDQDIKVSQSDLADQAEDAIKDPAKVDPKLLLKAEDLDSCYSPIIQSGSLDDKFDLKPSAQSTNNPLAYDSGTTIIIQLGARYKNYCSNIGRTYFINPTDEQKAVYHVLMDVYMACKKVMRHGQKVAAVYAAAIKAIQDAKRADLLPKFTKSCGFGMGLEFREGLLVLNDKNPRLLQKGMVFNLSVGFSDLVTKATKATGGVARQYAVLLADTVAIGGPADEPESYTRLPREFKQVSYQLGGDDDAPMEDGDTAAARAAAAEERRSTRGVGKDALRTDEKADESEAKRAAHQKELARRKQEDALRRFAEGGVSNNTNANFAFDLSEKPVYESIHSYPKDARANHVYVDNKEYAILFPINDQLVPFHISTVVKVYRRDENGFTYMNIKFAVPDTAAAKAKMKVQKNFQYISELSYRTSTTALDKPFFEIEAMRKQWIGRVKEAEVKSSLVAQEELRLDRKGPPPILKDVSVRPNLSKKKTTGTLTAHLNGLRFVTTDKVKIDIIYANIKSAFYQPAEEGNHNVTIHFELKDPILVDKTKTKKTNHLQFFVEVVESSEDLSMSSRFRDEDGLAEEQEERRRKKKWNERFLGFVKEVEEKLQKDDTQAKKLEFDIPYKELAFMGVPAKQQVQIMPTVHSLVALDDTPPMVINLSEVEIANFERIQFGLKNFDLVFVWKDFTKPPMRIEAIPVKSFEPIKHWLNSCDIVFYENSQNVLWKQVMKQINLDIEGFWQDGGFDALRDQSDDEEGEEEEEEEEEEETAAAPEGEEGAAAAEGGAKPKASAKAAGGKKKKKPADEESESDFEPSGSDASDSEEYETPDEEEEGSGGSDSDAGSAASGSGSEAEENLSWEEMEEKAKKDDKQKAVKARQKQGSDADLSSGESDDERPKKKQMVKKGATGSSGAKPASKPSAAGAKPVSRPLGSVSGSARPLGSSSGIKPSSSGAKPIQKK